MIYKDIILNFYLIQAILEILIILCLIKSVFVNVKVNFITKSKKSRYW